MRSASLLFLLTLTASATASAAEPFRMSLMNDTVGELPKGWVSAKTGTGPGSVWKVVDDVTATGGRALAQTSADGQRRFRISAWPRIPASPTLTW